MLGFALGAYHYEEFTNPRRLPARLVLPEPRPKSALAVAAATWLVARPHQRPGQHPRPRRACRRGGGHRVRVRRRRDAHRGCRARDALSRHRRGGRRFRPPADRGAHRMGRQRRAPGGTPPRPLRQGRLFRYRRPRPQALRRDAADEEGHGRRGGGAWARPARDGGGPSGAALAPPRLRGEQRIRGRDAPARRHPHAPRACRRGRQHGCRGHVSCSATCSPRRRPRTRPC